MKKLIVLCSVISMVLLAGTAFADETYTCTNAGMERVITIVYQDQEAKVPCEVHYTKDGATETLWSAQGQVGYCEEKVAAFLEKQRGWGWECTEAGASMPEEGMMKEGMMKDGMMQEGMMKEGMNEEMKGEMKEEMKGEMKEESK